MATTSGAITNPTSPQPIDASASAVKVEYWHKDHLGSISAITNATGVVTQRMAYDPFGKRREASGTYDAQGKLIVDNAQGTDRGFTGHEHMDDIGVIHMNGRVYDPTIGRFMQPDPLISQPSNLQNFDRYSYVLNNPLNLVDPSGFDYVLPDGSTCVSRATSGGATCIPDTSGILE
jgi:RHS repeat-associated protein